MKKIVLVLLTVLLSLTCFGCSGGEKEIDESPLIELIKGVQPSTVGFYSAAELQNVEDYKDAKFIVVTPIKTDEDAAIEDLKNTMRWDKVNVESHDSILEAINALTKESDSNRVLVINDAYIDAIKNNELIGGALDSVKPIYSYNAETAYDFSLTDKPFQVAVYGEDTRGAEILYNCRYDTDMLLTVNPTTKQVLIVSIPRDAYVPNHAHGSENDKLTHLGDDGPENSMAGLSDVFGMDIKMYVLSNFAEFIKLVDILGGLDFYNPYTFVLDNGGVGTFYEGNIHINGSEALGYARERYSLDDGDLDRCKHNVILLKAIMDKMMKLENLVKFDEIMNQIKNCFLTNISMKQMYGLAVLEYTEKPEWNIVSYRIDAEYSLRNTATYSNQGKLMTADLYQPDVDYCIAEMNKVMNGEIITQGTLPSE